MSELVKYLKANPEVCEQLTTGDVISLDPSIGSLSSKLGYATYKEMQLVDAGVLDIDSNQSPEERIAQIGQALEQEFQQADVAVVEYIPPSFNPKSGRNSRWITADWKKLHEAAGACISSSRASYHLRVHPATWKKYARDYEKSDAADAILIGYAAIAEACKLLKIELPTKYYLVEDATDEIT